MTKMVHHRRRCFGLRLLMTVSLIFCSIASAAATDGVWSPWYNSSPWQPNTVEDETLDRIEKTNQLPCKRSAVVAVQCRTLGSNVTFSGQFRHGDNVLHVPCNLSGLLCRPHDQILAGTAPCRDYEIRVLCLVDDDNQNKPGTDDSDSDFNDVGVKGGFTAMVAGGAVVIPLTCVLVYQLRRYKREERQRQQQGQLSSDGSAEGGSSVSDNPPAYEELFGNAEPVSVISQGGVLSGSWESSPSSFSTPTTTPPSTLLEDEGRDRSRLLTSTSPSPSSAAAGTGTAGQQLEGRVNHGASLENLAVTTQTLPGVVAPAPATPEVSSPPSVVADSSSSAASTPVTYVTTVSSGRTLTSCTDTLRPPSRDLTSRGPPPAYDWSRPDHVTIVVSADQGSSGGGVGNRTLVSDTSSSSSLSPSSSSSSPSVHLQQPTSSSGGGGRRFLGMHLSIFDLISAIYPDPASTPPPSYDDALKILEASKEPQVQVT